MGRNDEVKSLNRPGKTTMGTRPKRGRNRGTTTSAVEYTPQVITFSCIFCNQPFESTNVLFDHMRRMHPNLCEIPQITADSEIVEELNGGITQPEKSPDIPVRKSVIQSSRGTSPESNKKLLMSEDEENSVDHLIEMVATDDDDMEEEDEEIESPPYEANSDIGSNYSDEVEQAKKGGKRKKESKFVEKFPQMDYQLNDDVEEGEEDDDAIQGDDEDYLNLMEPICELTNCNESETEEFQHKLQQSIKLPKAAGRGRRRDNGIEELAGDQAPSEGFFQCTVCNKSFTFAGDLARHVRSHTLNKPYQCSICDKSFTHIGSLNTHLRIHTGVKPYKCSKCEKSFTQSSSLMVHARTHDTKKPISCHICEKGFMNEISLQMHLKCHKDGVTPGDDQLPCPKCDKRFKHEHVLNEHLRVHEELNLYQCSICRLQFATGSDLVQHLKRHTGEKPFQCAICGKSFTQPGSLSTHTRTHTGERPHCCPHCDKSFTQASSLSVHLKIHSPEKPFWCHICERSYSQQAYFNKHMSYHAQDKFAPCPLCNAVIFDAEKQLVKHFNKYHYDKQDKVFLCSICNVRYEDPQLLIAHVKIHFNNNNALKEGGGGVIAINEGEKGE